ncbi:MAG TPA: FIST C-terminal domain-containing protein, partial [Myxococcales bacterium]|nr:FIST C-terminal domain-containing protein [Myxococcales bacterium]
QLMKADYDRLIGGASGAAQSARQLASAGQGATLALAVSCVGRRLVLGERTEEEVEAVLDVLPQGSQIVGFYSYGEISPYATGQCDLHNQTMTLTTFSESAAVVARPAPAGASAPAVAPRRPAPAAVQARSAVSGTPMPSAPTHTPTPMAPPPPHAPAVVDLPMVSATGPEPETLTGARAVRLTAGTDPQAGLSISKKMVGPVQVVSFAGRLSESFQGARAAAELGGTVVMDLSGITRVTSFGVREWLQMLQESESRVEALYLARCSEAVSNQLTMIRRFAGKGQVVSFYAPYLCSGCGTAFAALLDCVKDAEAIKAERPPDATCPRCAKPGVFDDDPRTYLTFGGQATRVPDDVRRAIAALEPDAAFEALEKRIEGDTTRVRVASALDGSLRWTRVLEGVEGDVAIDLSGVPSSTGEGVQHLLEGLNAVDTEVKSLRLEGVPGALLQSLAEASVSRPKLRLASTRIEGYCATCTATRPAEVRLDGDLESLAKGQMPEVACRRCHGPLGYETAYPAIRAAAKTLLKRPRAAAAAPAGAPAASRRAPSPRLGMMLGIGGGAVVAVAQLVGAGAMLATRGRAPQEPAVAAAALPVAAAGAPAPANPNGWRSENGLLPGWADNPVAVQGGGVYVVGRGSGATEEEALQAARAEATDRLVRQLLQGLQGKPIADLVRASGADASAENAAAVAQRFQRQLGAAASLERTDTAVREKGGHQELVARYRIGQDAFKAAVDRYARTAAFRGITVAP